jgi:hypothetical protein
MTGQQPGAPQLTDPVLVSPAYLAGTGDSSIVLSPLVHVHEWPHHVDRSTATATATSPCGRIEAAFEPGRVFHWWRVSARRSPGGEPVWQATFTEHTPEEVIAALTQALAADRYTRAEEFLGDQTASPTTAWRPLLSAGWALDDSSSFLSLSSPLGRTDFSYWPEDPETAWRITNTTGPSEAAWWSAEFTPNTPVRYLHFVAARLADPEPVVRARAEQPHDHLSHLTVWPMPPGRATRAPTAITLAGAMFNPTHRTSASGRARGR